MAKSPFKYCRLDAKGFLTDPLLNSPSRRGDFASLMALAKIINCNGYYLDEKDEPYSLDDLKKRGQVSKKGLTYFINSKRLIKKDGAYYLKNWPKYQDNYDRRGDEYKTKPQNDSEPDNETEEPLPLPKADIKPDLEKPLNDSEIMPSVQQEINNQGGVPKELQVLLNKHDEYCQMASNPKYGSDQLKAIKENIKLYERKIGQWRKDHPQHQDEEF